ncbi:hypothetical protein AJ80_08634 [Polytolypa hystricis UAMH7299]|uniref:Uncharacterized protein n=1 Tax=Polytolypa hystricis (strain UAMH7299) TaxID=1447883 RepID=A0A2B7WWJ6_POLH7|nr:hypothetical protein AJ80_08634 [Polytolypa hystricis UAMH7299]
MSGSGSISKAFSRRQKAPDISQPIPHREGQTRLKPGTIKRNNISLPVQLLSTTNQLVYTAPDLRPSPSSALSPKPSSSSSSLGSAEDSDTSSFMRSISSPITSPEISSDEVSPVGPEPNHLSSFFESHKRTRTSTSSVSRSRSSASSSSAESPMIPQRALSHTKQSHQELARQRSRSKMAPPPTSLTNTHALHSSLDSTPHPFGKELEQVNEVAEEFGGAHAVLDEEERILMTKGLFKFTAEDYLVEIQDLYRSIFGDESRPREPVWI